MDGCCADNFPCQALAPTDTGVSICVLSHVAASLTPHPQRRSLTAAQPRQEHKLVNLGNMHAEHRGRAEAHSPAVRILRRLLTKTATCTTMQILSLISIMTLVATSAAALG